jgi:hypothetical protein
VRVFIFDMGWRGGLVILANSPEDALEKLPPEERVSDRGGNYTPEDFVELTEVNSPYRLYGDQ